MNIGLRQRLGNHGHDRILALAALEIMELFNKIYGGLARKVWGAWIDRQAHRAMTNGAGLGLGLSGLRVAADCMGGLVCHQCQAE